MIANPLRQADLFVRRDHTLGTLMERLAQLRGSTVLVEEPDVGLHLTVAEAAGRVAAWAGGLAQLTEPGDVVVVAAPNGYEMALLCLAAARAGAIPAPVNDQMRPNEIAHVVAYSGARLTLQGAHELPEAPPLARAVAAQPSAVAALFYTSGTTGKPKGVELTHRSLVGGLMAGVAFPAGIRRDEAVMSLPLAHIMGFSAVLGLACAGIPVYFMAKFHPLRVLDAIESRRASVFVGVPAMYRMLADAGADEHDLRSIRMWMSGADAMPADLAARFKKMGATMEVPLIGPVGEAMFVEGYGMVETGGGVAAKLSPPMMGFGLGSSMGMALPGYRFRVVADDGSTVRLGSVGQLQVKGPGLLKGYRGDADATAATFTDDGWLRTGDLARVGPFGSVFFVGRGKDVIKHGGYSVYSVEVEQVLEQHPDVVEAAVIALPDERHGEVPAAVVTLRAGVELDAEALAAWAAERLSEYKVPVRFVATDELPHTGTDKIQRSGLARLFEPGA